MIKNKTKQKHLLPFSVANSKLKKFCINNNIIKTESKDESKEIDIKNRMRYYFDDIIKYKDIWPVNILLEEKLY